MNERGTEVLSQYNLDVIRTCRVRGAVLCETRQGLKLLKEWKGTQERLLFEDRVLSALNDNTGILVDSYIRTMENTLSVQGDDRTTYVVKNWFEGRECNVRDNRELALAIRMLAGLHRGLEQAGEIIEQEQKNNLKDAGTGENAEENDRVGVSESLSEGGLQSLADGKQKDGHMTANQEQKKPESQAELYARRNREIKKVYRFSRERKKKTDFERLVIQSYCYFFEQAKKAEEMFSSFVRPVPLRLCHGEYSQHHVLIGPYITAVTDFSRMHWGVQVTDLYYFIRKILEKHRWDINLGTMLLQAYEGVRPLEAWEWNYLYLLFLYPEKYWKQLNYYYNSNKAWIPARNIEKLQVVVNQKKAREDFLEKIYGKTTFDVL